MQTSNLTCCHEHAEPTTRDSMHDHATNMALPCKHCQVGHTCTLWTHTHQHSPVQTATTLLKQSTVQPAQVACEHAAHWRNYHKYKANSEALYTDAIMLYHNVAHLVGEHKCM